MIPDTVIPVRLLVVVCVLILRLPNGPFAEAVSFLFLVIMGKISVHVWMGVTRVRDTVPMLMQLVFLH